MGLKDEIDKLIQAERKKLAERAEFGKSQVQRLQVMRTLLEEVAASVDENYLDVGFVEGKLSDIAVAFVDVGRIDQGRLDIRWQISPNSTPDYWDAKPAQGFEVTVNEGEEVLNFQTEEEVIQYILPKIAEKVAYYEHLKDRSEDQ